jgi:hypothetical protein
MLPVSFRVTAQRIVKHRKNEPWHCSLQPVAEKRGFAVGWIFVAVIIASLAAAIYLVRKGARRWWDYLVIAGLMAALCGITSAMTTVLLPLVLAAGAVCAVHRVMDFARADRVAS